MKYVKKIFLIGAAGLTFFALSACDDSSSAGGDETETSALSCSAEMSSASRHCEDCKDEAISSDSKSTDPAEATDKSSDSKARRSDRQVQRQQGQSFFGRNIDQVQQLEFIWNDYEVKQQFCEVLEFCIWKWTV